MSDGAAVRKAHAERGCWSVCCKRAAGWCEGKWNKRVFSLEKGMDLNRERSVDWTKSFGTQTQHFSILLPPSILPLAFASAARVWPFLKTDFGGEERVFAGDSIIAASGQYRIRFE